MKQQNKHIQIIQQLKWPRQRAKIVLQSVWDAYLLCLRVSLLSSVWPRLTRAATSSFVHLICLLIVLPGDLTMLAVSLWIAYLLCPPPPSPSIPATGDLMKNSVTMSDLSHHCSPVIFSYLCLLLLVRLSSASCRT